MRLFRSHILGLFLFIFLQFFLGFFSFLPSARAVANVITTVEFVGYDRVPLESLQSIIVARPGIYYSDSIVDRDLKALYKLGQFNDIQVEKVNRNDGVLIRYVLVETSFVKEVLFKGNKKLKDEDLQDEITIKTNRPLSEIAVNESLDMMRKAYAKKGYYLASIDYTLEKVDERNVNLVFHIHENKGVVVRKIFFIGNTVFSDDELRSLIRTRKKTAFSFFTGSGKYENAELNLDKTRLAFHYLNHGYFKVKITPPKVTISRDKKYIFVTFTVDEGLQYRIGSVDIEGDILTTKQELLKSLELKTGDIFKQEFLEKDISALTTRYGDQGYAFANIYPKTTADDATKTVDLIYSIEKGKPITIEKINIFGNTTTRDKVIRRELKVVENSRYSERDISESKRKLQQLGFFEEVNFATPRGSTDDTVILNVTVKERPTGSFNIGAGFSSVENFIFNASVQKQNFLGYGISSQIALELSKRRQFFDLSFEDPYFLDTKWIAGTSFYRNAFLYSDFRRTSLGGSTSLGRRFYDKWSASIAYLVESVDVSSFSSIVPQVFRLNSDGLTSSFSFTLSRDTRNDRIIPSKGTFNTASTEISGNKLGGDNDFFRVNYKSMYYQPLGKGIVFKAFGKIGYINSLNTSQVPLFERFFTGGPNSLRGYFPQSVGPSIRVPNSATGGDTDFVYGGDKLLLFVTELELPLARSAGISLVGFFDAGNAFAEDQNYSFSNLKKDYGFGFRWNSPMGPLRFEWGFPLDPKPGDDSVVFNFAIGDFF